MLSDAIITVLPTDMEIIELCSSNTNNLYQSFFDRRSRLLSATSLWNQRELDNLASGDFDRRLHDL